MHVCLNRRMFQRSIYVCLNGWTFCTLLLLWYYFPLSWATYGLLFWSQINILFPNTFYPVSTPTPTTKIITSINDSTGGCRRIFFLFKVNSTWDGPNTSQTLFVHSKLQGLHDLHQRWAFFLFNLALQTQNKEVYLMPAHSYHSQTEYGWHLVFFETILHLEKGKTY